MHTNLALALRPKNLDEYVGQSHLVGAGMPLRLMVENSECSSLIFWGPPGVGKTTLARLITGENRKFYELSAVSAGKKDIRDIVASVLPIENPPVLFLDEIHRFNKAQQDYLLPFVEAGNIVLIGATTENPSFEIIPALLSRLKVFTLKPLTPEELEIILDRALALVKKQDKKLSLKKVAKSWVIDYSWGDARKLLNLLDTTLQLYNNLELESLKNTAQNNVIPYDKAADLHYDTISAFIKSMRAGDPSATLYYLARMVEAGEDPLFIARRMVVFASEDVGMAQPTALVVANEVFRACETIGYPECAINLAHGVVYLASAKKDRRAYDGLRAAQKDVQNFGPLPIPLDLRNAPTGLMKDLGYGKNYQMYHDKSKSLLPKKLGNKKYF